MLGRHYRHTIWFNQPATSINGQNEVKAKPAFHATWKKGQNTDATITIKDKKSGDTLWFGSLDSERLYATPDTLSGSTLEVSTVNDHYLGETTNDWGVWTAYTKADPHHWQSGVVYSPCRVAYGTLAPGIYASQWAAGVGISFYPPEGYLPSVFSQTGLTAGYLFPYSGRSPGYAIGLSLTTHH